MSDTAWRQTLASLVSLGESDWVFKAKCFGHPRASEVFFPHRGANKRVEEAKEICAKCPVRLDCLEFAITNNEEFGIWGGLSEDERHRMPKRTNRPLSDLVRVCPGCNFIRVFYEKESSRCDQCRKIPRSFRKKGLNRPTG